ncbi:hypothetical protein D3C79_946010 [compost metagenome]
MDCQPCRTSGAFRHQNTQTLLLVDLQYLATKYLDEEQVALSIESRGLCLHFAI